MGEQSLVVGFGVVGASATRYLLGSGFASAGIAVVDLCPDAVERATGMGVRAILGDGTDRQVLATAMPGPVGHAVVAVGDDQAALLITMLIREVRPAAKVVTAVREDSHLAYVHRHGADFAMTTAEVTGTVLGRALSGQGERDSRMPPMPWTVEERLVLPSQVGQPITDCDPAAVGVVRGTDRFWGPDAAQLPLEPGDHLVLLRAQPTHRTDC
ncbi:NAD-binding protein [Saccharothrix sp. AJ9571]|nr:NAD-binding protein [Saccharothrix sp. AJ9571]